MKVTNTGERAGDEVVPLYLKDEKGSTPRPRYQLEGFERIFLRPGQSKVVTFQLSPRQFSMIGKDENRLIEKGWFTVSEGSGQPGFSSSTTLSARIKLTGKNVVIK